MKYFLKRTGLFILLFIIFLSVITLFNRIIFKVYNPLALGEDINVLIIGDSHTKYAFNDDLLPNVYNLSNDADSYFYSYYKLSNTIKLNPQIDTVFLAFSIHNVHKFIEDKWILNASHLKSKLKIYLPLLSTRDYIFLFSRNPEVVTQALMNQIFFLYYLRQGKERFGGYDDLDYDILISELKDLRLNGREEYKDFEESEIEKRYLKKIIAYCQSKNITLNLVNTPLHPSINQQQENLYRYYQKNFSDIPFYDFSQVEMNESYFGDLVHLTPDGAEYFSQMIKKENLLNPNRARVHKLMYEIKSEPN